MKIARLSKAVALLKYLYWQGPTHGGNGKRELLK